MAARTCGWRLAAGGGRKRSASASTYIGQIPEHGTGYYEYSSPSPMQAILSPSASLWLSWKDLRELELSRIPLAAEMGYNAR